MQTTGSLQESDLASLLQTMQSERATGTLTLEDGGDQAALYFLFGHLFHASGPGGEGEPVVVTALGWHAGNFRFDPRAKLPAEETIKSSPAELIAAAEGASQAAPGQNGDRAGATPTLTAIDGEAGAEAEPVHAPASEASDWKPAASLPAAEPASAAQGNWTAPAYTPSEYAPVTPAPTEAPAQRPAAGEAATGGLPAVRAGSTAGGFVGSLPIPAGKVQYEGLKSAFVDFPRLLRTLRGERHTGYIRLLSGAATGVLLLRDGELVEAEAGDDGVAHGEEAFIIFRRQMDTGEGVIDVIDLDSDTVSAVARLLTGPALFTGLLGRFVNFPALLEYLAEEKVDGSVIVAGGSQAGVILLSSGGVLAAYTADERAPLTATEAVEALAAERTAIIEVRGDDRSRSGIDVEAALSRPH
ncbi:MAG TPA: DUF4388 domain-containing protein [Candidatus Dormibacteraeota bacterium]|nr:DUF4388 domain-containing protein [Candidatus Dormibacteraeota bacterium]